VPALRERRKDIPLLVEAFVEEYAQKLKRRIDVIPEEVMAALVQHTWPGNIRELRNFIERSVILSKGPVLRPPLDCLRRMEELQVSKTVTLREAECDHILNALKETRWTIGGPRGAARQLGVPRTTLISKMRKLGLSRPALS